MLLKVKRKECVRMQKYANGTQMEHKWKAKGIKKNHEGNAKRTQKERERNAKRTRKEHENNAEIFNNDKSDCCEGYENLTRTYKVRFIIQNSDENLCKGKRVMYLQYEFKAGFKEQNRRLRPQAREFRGDRAKTKMSH